jgi:hypothetical protein
MTTSILPPPKDALWYEVTLDERAAHKQVTVQATNWHTALKTALRLAGDKAKLGPQACCDVLDDGTLRVSEPGSGRVFRLKSRAEPVIVGTIEQPEGSPENDQAPLVLQPDMSEPAINATPEDDEVTAPNGQSIEPRPDRQGRMRREDDDTQSDGGNPDRRIGPPRIPFTPLAKMPSLDVQHIWFEVARTRSEWRTLAVVCASPNLDSMHVSHALSQMAALDPSDRVLLVNATPKKSTEGVVGKVEDIDSDLGGMKHFVDGNYDLIDVTELGRNDAEVGLIYTPQLLDYLTAKDRKQRYTTVVLALGCLLTQATSIPVARTADKVILVVGLEKTSFHDAKRSVEIIGKERIAGAVSVRPR